MKNGIVSSLSVFQEQKKREVCSFLEHVSYQSQYIYAMHTYIKQLCIMSISDRFFFSFRTYSSNISFLSSLPSFSHIYNFCLLELLIFTFSNLIVQRPSLSFILSSILMSSLAVFLINFQFINTACNIHSRTLQNVIQQFALFLFVSPFYMY